jgi:hypothetical protein
VESNLLPTVLLLVIISARAAVVTVSTIKEKKFPQNSLQRADQRQRGTQRGIPQFPAIPQHYQLYLIAPQSPKNMWQMVTYSPVKLHSMFAVHLPFLIPTTHYQAYHLFNLKI